MNDIICVIFIFSSVGVCVYICIYYILNLYIYHIFNKKKMSENETITKQSTAYNM